MIANALRDPLRQARQELAGNRRLQVGVLLIAAILLLYLWLLAGDWRTAAERDLAAARQRLQRIESLVGQDVWLERAAAAADLADALDAQVPAIDTPGLAQASVQTWARELTAAHGEAVRVQSDAPTRIPGSDIWRVPMTLSGALPPRSVLQLIQRIESHAQLRTIEQATLVNRANQTFSLTVVAFYRIAEDADDAR